MIYVIIAVVVIVFVCANRARISGIISSRNFFGAPPKVQDADLVKALLSLDDESLEELLALYENQFGSGAGKYARKTFQKWKAGEVRPNRQTFERFLLRLPAAMSYDLKCEVLRRLMEEYCSKNDYQISVDTDDWEKTLEPLVKQLVDKPYAAALPRVIEEKLHWLADGEMQIAQDILKKSQIEEGKIAVSMLREEFAAIENLLVETKGERRVTHQLKFPYGTITLKIKRK